MKLHCFAVILLFVLSSTHINAQNKVVTTRKEWLHYLDKVARPVLSAMADDALKEKMPLVLSQHVDNPEARTKAAYLEAFGRTMSGIGPWLNLEGGSSEELSLRNQYRDWALRGIANAVNPMAKTYLSWTGSQPLVDASFLALGLVRCPWLWEHLADSVRAQVINAFHSIRNTTPGYNNWILFSGMIEAFFCKYNIVYDALRIEYGIREFSQHW